MSTPKDRLMDVIYEPMTEMKRLLRIEFELAGYSQDRILQNLNDLDRAISEIGDDYESESVCGQGVDSSGKLFTY
jgi:hypothetical protein